MSAELVGAFGASEAQVGLRREALGVSQDAYLPYRKGYQRENEKRRAEESAHKNHGREHHKVIPVKDSAGGAASITEKKPKGAKDKHANKVANVKRNGYNKYPGFIQGHEIVKKTYHDGQSYPHKENSEICLFCGASGEFFQSFAVIFLLGGSISVGKILCRAQGKLIFYGYYLRKHADHPNDPHDVENREIVVKSLSGEYVEEVKAFHHVEAIAQKGAFKEGVLSYKQYDAENQHHTAENQF